MMRRILNRGQKHHNILVAHQRGNGGLARKARLRSHRHHIGVELLDRHRATFPFRRIHNPVSSTPEHSGHVNVEILPSNGRRIYRVVDGPGRGKKTRQKLLDFFEIKESTLKIGRKVGILARGETFKRLQGEKL